MVTLAAVVMVNGSVVEFEALTEWQIGNLNKWDLNRYTTWLLEENDVSWSGRKEDEENPQQFAQMESRFLYNKCSGKSRAS